MLADTQIQPVSHRVENDDSPIHINPHWNRLVIALTLSLAAHAGLVVSVFPQRSLHQSLLQQTKQPLVIHLTSATPKQPVAQTIARPPARKKPRTRATIKPTPPRKVVSPTPKQPSPPQLTTNAIPVTAPMVTYLSKLLSTITSPPRLAPSIQAIYTPRPVYPKLALRLGLEGKVILRVWVSVDGVPSDIEVKKSSGYEILDVAAKHGVRQWRFKRHGGIAELDSGWINLPVTFRLE